MDDDLFTYEVAIANISYDSKMDDDSGDDEVELMNDEFSDNEDEVAEVFRIDTNIFDFETPMCKAFKEFNYVLQIDPDLLTKDIEGFKTYEDYKDDWIYEWNKDVPWVDEKPWTNTRDYEWYEALEDSEIKDEALRNKAIMEGFIDDDESRYEQMRRWNIYTNYDYAYEINHEDNEREELYEIPVCNIRIYMMIKYSFNNDEEYVAVKKDEYNDLTITRKEACRAYQEIFRKMDEGWMVTRAEYNGRPQIEEYIKLQEEKAQRAGRTFNWQTAIYGKVKYYEDEDDCFTNFESEFPSIVFDDTISFDESDDEDYTPEVSYSNDLDFFKDFENEFPAIVYNDALTSKSNFLTEPTVSPQHIDEFNLKNETSLSKCDEKEQNVLYFNDLFPFNEIYPDDLKSDKDNDIHEIDIEQSLWDMSIIPLPNVINIDDGSYALRDLTERKEEIGGVFIIWNSRSVRVLTNLKKVVQHILARKLNLENYHEQTIREFSILILFSLII
ncbi:hypothetical protein Tco_0356697 [Tanacetum coccineum]